MSHKRMRPPAIGAIALAAALAAAGPAVWAASSVDTMLASGSYQLGTDAVQSLTSGFPSNNPVDVLFFPNSGSNSAGLHSYGSVDGNFGSRSSGYGIYDVSGSFRIVETITNTSSVAQNATFNFYITPGLLSNEIGSTLTGAQYVTAGLSFDIRRDGTSVWGSAASLTTNASGTSFLANPAGDTSLYSANGALGTPTYYTVGGVNRSVDLGVINAGQSIQLSYELDTFARGSSTPGADRVVPPTTYHVPDQWVVPGCGGYGYGGYGYGGYGCTGTPVLVPAHDVPVNGYIVPGTASGSHASSGDPFQIDFSNGSPIFTTNAADPFGSSVVLAAAVPEPSTYAMLLAGMGLIGWTARRRRQQHTSAL